MRIHLLLLLCIPFATGACSNDAVPGANVPSAINRGGTIIIGEQTWTLVASMQCSIYPNDQVNVSGHAEGDEDYEMVVDYYPDGDGPIGLAGGKYAAAGSFRSERETMQFEFGDRQVSGSGTFKVYSEEGPVSIEGTFDITC